MKDILIIAECCQNHNGDFNILKKMVKAAANAGADYVKIQAMRSIELTNRPQFNGDDNNSLKRPYQSEFDRLAKNDLSRSEEQDFVYLCEDFGVKSMITPFTTNGLCDIANMGYDAVKIASYDCGSTELIKLAKNNFSEIFVSTGASYDDEITECAKILENSYYHFLHCVTVYPTPLEILNLRRMKYLRRFTPFVGFSDHSLVPTDGIKASQIALFLGASCVERHFTILPQNQTKDGPVSINASQLLELKQFSQLPKAEQFEIITNTIPNWKYSLGKMNNEMSAAEKQNRDYYKGRFENVNT